MSPIKPYPVPTEAQEQTLLFRWAPSVGAWQRQLTDNGRRAADRVKSKLEKLN